MMVKDMKSIEKLLEKYNAGRITQSELEHLYNAFVADGAVRDKWPVEANAILPLALARADYAEKRRWSPSHNRVRKVAAVAVLVVSVATAYAAYARAEQTSVYSVSGDCDIDCAVQWLNQTLETAL